MIHVNPEITLITSVHCSECKLLKDWLTGMGVRFAEQQLFDTTGTYQSGPLTILGERVISGPVSEQKRVIFDALAITVLG